MSRLAERVKKLEGGTGNNLNATDCIVIRPMSPSNMEADMATLEGYGKRIERTPDEGEDEFINRAKAAMRAAGITEPVLMLFAQ